MLCMCTPCLLAHTAQERLQRSTHTYTCSPVTNCVYTCVRVLHCHTGGYFDPLGLASDNDPDKVFRLKTAEIKHGRLAMVAFLGECVAFLFFYFFPAGVLCVFCTTQQQPLSKLQAALCPAHAAHGGVVAACTHSRTACQQ